MPRLQNTIHSSVSTSQKDKLAYNEHWMKLTPLPLQDLNFSMFKTHDGGQRLSGNLIKRSMRTFISFQVQTLISISVFDFIKIQSVI